MAYMQHLYACSDATFLGAFVFYRNYSFKQWRRTSMRTNPNFSKAPQSASVKDNVQAWTGVYYRNHEAPAVPLNFKNVIIHPLFESTQIRNDISLIELATPIQFDDHTQPVCLPSADKGVDVPTNRAWATGWGNLEFQGASSDTLRQVEIPFVDNLTCESSWKEVSGYKLNETLQLWELLKMWLYLPVSKWGARRN
uniref:Peptidase S1 domain-containing protein n=1 Tax=Panagrellus redivivus TaxID=6233 RepID=A0A7E4W8G7_PANRE